MLDRFSPTIRSLKEKLFPHRASIHRAIMLITTVIIIFWIGRLSVYYQQLSSEPIREVGEINEKIPLVNIVEVTSQKIIGYTSDKNMRIKSLDKSVAVPDADLRFELDTSHFGFLGNKSIVIEHEIPDWAVYVASKSGKNFYPVDSGNGKHISVPNRVYFKTKEEALAAGFKEGN